MPLATDKTGILTPIQSTGNANDCSITIPSDSGPVVIVLNNLPEIADSKSASYADEGIIGRAMPLKTYSHSENRVISTKLTFFTIQPGDYTTPGTTDYNLAALRALESAVYPRDPSSNNSLAANGLPYSPPPVCSIQCGQLLGNQPLCAVLTRYSVDFPTDVAWDEATLLPYKFTVDCEWHVVYTNSNLPGSDRILGTGR